METAPPFDFILDGGTATPPFFALGLGHPGLFAFHLSGG